MDDYKIKPFLLTLPKTISYIKLYDRGAKRQYSLIENDDLLMIIIYDYDKDNSINDNEIFINDFLIIFEIKSAIVLKGI